MNALNQLFRLLGPQRVIAMVAVTALLIGFFVVLTFQFSRTAMVPLYSDLTLEDSSAIIRELDIAGIPYELSANGTFLKVPSDEVLGLRMLFAEKSIPSGGSVGYEIFDRTDSLGTTSFVQNVNRVRAMEGELGRTIRTLSKVRTARVHLVLPERPLFSRKAVRPTASVFITLRAPLDQAQVKAIRHLVAASVPSLTPENIAVIDDDGRLLASSSSGENSFAPSSDLQGFRVELEQRMKQDIQDIVASVVGTGRVRVRVAAELNLNQITKTANVYDPEGAVIRSTNTRDVSNSQNETEPNDTVSASNDLPGGTANSGGNAQRAEDSATAEETVNYEISKSTQTEIVAPGSVLRLSVAVLVDGRYEPGGEGNVKYIPRAEDELEKIQSLVMTAIGFDSARGDKVEVVNLRFAGVAGAMAPDSEAPTLWEEILVIEPHEVMRMAEVLVTLLLGLAVLLFAVRPLMRRAFRSEIDGNSTLSISGSGKGASGSSTSAGEEGNVAQLEHENGSGIPNSSESADGQLAAHGGISDAISESQKVGKIHAEAIQKVIGLVESDPKVATSVVRRWMQTEASA